MRKQSKCLVVITKDMYYMKIIKFYCKLKSWKITVNGFTHAQIKVGEW